MDPLAGLQPLIEPTPVAWWPPAPGWWLLALLLPLLGWGLWRLRHRLPRLKTRTAEPTQAVLDPQRKAALLELAAFEKPYGGAPAAAWLQQLNGLLKRLCRAHYPQSNSHVLSGRAWLAFLDGRCPAAGLTRWMVLVEGAYRGNCRLEDKAIDQLQQAIDTWIRKHV